jgi:GrpB-like predicted nucleotidyltransferase (UPF0157 family)
MVRRVEVVPYDPDWPHLFRMEADRITAILGEEVVAIHHIGSTAIPNIRAKPIIDVLVEVQDIEKIDDFNEEMIERGYRPQGEFGIPGRRFFIKGDAAARTHHVHVFQTSHPRIERYLNFRDYMTAHPGEARAYSRLKEELARRFPADIEGYMAGKDGFIKEVEGRARDWAEGRRSREAGERGGQRREGTCETEGTGHHPDL